MAEGAELWAAPSRRFLMFPSCAGRRPVVRAGQRHRPGRAHGQAQGCGGDLDALGRAAGVAREYSRTTDFGPCRRFPELARIGRGVKTSELAVVSPTGAEVQAGASVRVARLLGNQAKQPIPELRVTPPPAVVLPTGVCEESEPGQARSFPEGTPAWRLGVHHHRHSDRTVPSAVSNGLAIGLGVPASSAWHSSRWTSVAPSHTSIPVKLWPSGTD
jgi:hypothetical protein